MATADLLNAFERRLPEGWFEPETLEPIAGLLGVDTVATRNDLEHERYLLARPGALWPDVLDALGSPDYTGPVVRDETEIPLIDERTLADVDRVETFPAVSAFDLQPAPLAQALSAESPVVMAGSAEGVVDLAGARLLDPDRPVLFTSTLDDLATMGEFDEAMLGSDPWWVVTDTNRRQARHWSTVSANLGALETADGAIGLDPDPGNQQLDVFLPENESGDEPRQTVAAHVADVADVRASYYGNRVAFTTGDAPAFAIDGDPSTAWRAGAFGPTTGLLWEVDLVDRVTTSTIDVLQPITGAVNRYIVEGRITLDADLETETSFDVILDENSRSFPGQTIELPTDSFRTLRFEVRRDNIGELSDYSAWPGIGLAEVVIPGVRDDRIVRVPRLDAFDIVDTDTIEQQRLSYLFTRQRIDPATPNEGPGETTMVREFSVPAGRSFTVSGDARVSADAGEDVLSDVFEDDAFVIADRRLRGSPASRGAVGVRRRPGHGLADTVQCRRTGIGVDRAPRTGRRRHDDPVVARRRHALGAHGDRVDQRRWDGPHPGGSADPTGRRPRVHRARHRRLPLAVLDHHGDRNRRAHQPGVLLPAADRLAARHQRDPVRSRRRNLVRSDGRAGRDLSSRPGHHR